MNEGDSPSFPFGGIYLLEIKNLNVWFGGLHAVKDFNMIVEDGEIHSLIGPNGAGKTTVFNAITKVIRFQGGEIVLDGENITRLKPHEIVRKGISRTFQNVVLFRYMTVFENLLVGYHTKYEMSMIDEVFLTRRYSRETLKAFSKVLDVADLLDLKNKLSLPASILPYGVQKVVEIGRALMADPKIVLLDEPVAGLTEVETKDMIRVIEKIRNDWKITIVLVEHDMSVVMNISDTITVMDFGRKIAEGKPEEIKRNPEVVKAYLGDDAIASGA